MEYLVINLNSETEIVVIIKKLLNLGYIFSQTTTSNKRLNKIDEIVPLFKPLRELNGGWSIVLGKFTCMKEWAIRQRTFWTDDYLTDNYFKVITIDEFLNDYINFELKSYTKKYETGTTDA